MTPNKEDYIQTITMIDPVIGYIEIHFEQEARADLIANQVELALLTRYPLSNEIIIDKAKKILAEFKSMMANDYKILFESISV